MKKSKLSLAIEWLETAKLIPYINNAKRHPVDQVAQIAASIREFGFNDPVAVDEQNSIIEGHGRLLAAQKLGLETVPVIRLEHLSEAQKKAYILAHNKLTLNTGFDPDLLRVELETLREFNSVNLTLTGFQEGEIDILFEIPSIPFSEPNLEAVFIKKELEVKPVTCPHCGGSFHV